MYYYKDEKSRFGGGRLFLIPLGDETLFLSMRNLFLFPLVDERLFWSY